MIDPSISRGMPMCNLYNLGSKDELSIYLRSLRRQARVQDYSVAVVGPFGRGVFLRPGEGDELDGVVGQWGLIRPGQPERIDYIQPRPVPGKKPRAPKARSTNNARVEDIAKKPTFKAAWLGGQRCLIPAAWYQEPNWETRKNVWWQLKRADGLPWMLAGLWSEWIDLTTGEVVPNYTMLTVNCNAHPLLNRLHRPELDDAGAVLPLEQQDKRSLVHIEPESWDLWLHGELEAAQQLLTPAPAEVFDRADARRTDELLAQQSAQAGLL